MYLGSQKSQGALHPHVSLAPWLTLFKQPPPECGHQVPLQTWGGSCPHSADQTNGHGIRRTRCFNLGSKGQCRVVHRRSPYTLTARQQRCRENSVAFIETQYVDLAVDIGYPNGSSRLNGRQSRRCSIACSNHPIQWRRPRPTWRTLTCAQS